MALTGAQQTKVAELRTLLEQKDILVRQAYPGMFATNGSFFFEFFQELEAKIKEIEKA